MSEYSSNGAPEFGQPGDASTDARHLARRAVMGALATVDSDSGHPYASLVTLATEPAGAPVLLISKLALHTRNLLADSRASILIDETGNDGNPLAGGRVTLIGRAEKTTSPTARRRFLARHPEAEEYVGFPDFAFYSLSIERGHFVGGFGRIVSLSPEDILTPLEGATSLVDAEADIIEHMNEDHADALALYASVLLGGDNGAWRLTGVDPDGCDLICGPEALRLPFANRVTSPGDARQEFVRLAEKARAQQSSQEK